jgi:hypothetical protein
MDFELKHLGQTLALGGFTIYFLLLLWKVILTLWDKPDESAPKRGSHNAPHPREKGEDKINWNMPEAAVFLALALAIGILLEDVAKAGAATRSDFLGGYFASVITNDGDLRIRSLLEDIRVRTAPALAVTAKPKPIFTELQNTAPPQPPVGHYFDELRQIHAIPSGDDKGLIILKYSNDEPAQFLASVQGAYYTAHNLVYRNANYYTEFTEISDRLEFTRALALLLHVLDAVYIPASVYILACALCCMPWRNHRPRRIFWQGFKILGFALFFAVGMRLSEFAYEDESILYNLRIFGYYISQLNLPDSSMSRIH